STKYEVRSGLQPRPPSRLRFPVLARPAYLFQFLSSRSTSYFVLCTSYFLRTRLRSHRRLGGRFFRRRRFDVFRLRLHQLDIQTERLELANEDVERHGQPGRERRVALDDGLVDLRAAR